MPATELYLDPANAIITFAVRWLGFVTVRGRFTDVRGVIRVPDGEVVNAEVTVEVAAASVKTGVALRDRHLRGAEFLDSSRFPVISFRSSEIERGNGAVLVRGVLELRGRKREISLSCRARPVAVGDNGSPPNALFSGGFAVPRLEHDVGAARGIHRLNPLLYAIGTLVEVQVELTAPATLLLPPLRPLPVPER